MLERSNSKPFAGSRNRVKGEQASPARTFISVKERTPEGKVGESTREFDSMKVNRGSRLEPRRKLARTCVRRSCLVEEHDTRVITKPSVFQGTSGGRRRLR